jgi:hypothetical protein
MSGNRKQDQVKPDCGDDAKASSTTTGRLKPLRLFSTLLKIPSTRYTDTFHTGFQATEIIFPTPGPAERAIA